MLYARIKNNFNGLIPKIGHFGSFVRFQSKSALVSRVPTADLNNGVQIPVLGIGLYKVKKENTEKVVKIGIDKGYRLIDCAYIFGNEVELGNAIRSKLGEGVVRREDLFVITKLWNTFHKPDMVMDGLQESLTNLGLSYIDLFLMHTPIPSKKCEASDPDAVKTIGGTLEIPIDIDYVSTWRAMEACVEMKLVRALGVSNFNSDQLKRVIQECKICPSVNQVEVHPYFSQVHLQKLCERHGVLLMGYSPFGCPDRPIEPGEGNMPLDDFVIRKIGEKYKKSAAQVILRWMIQRGMSSVFRSCDEKHLKENIDVLDFALTESEMNGIFELNRNYRVSRFEDDVTSKYWPFTLNY